MADLAELNNVIESLKNLQTTSTENKTQLLEKFIKADPSKHTIDTDNDLIDLLISTLNDKESANDKIELKTKAANCIAELTKNELNRKKFTQQTIIRALIEQITDVDEANPSIELIVQVCRALGNVFYQNDEARDILIADGGDAWLIKLLDLKVSGGAEEVNLQFVKMRCGLISNYLVGGEAVAKRAMELSIMEKIEKTVAECAADVEHSEDLLLNTLPPLSILTENVPDLNFAPALNKQLVKILAMSKNPDVAEMCLDLLHYQAENDDVKLLLAKEGLCETIYRLLEKYKTLASTNEARALMKLACDLVVLILTGDDSMHYLYTTPLLKYIEDWLDSYDIDLLTTGVLALGNFARTDSHCIYMVEKKIMNKLIEILSKNNGIDDDMRLQHALLSALRNLVIPKPNKPAIIEAGLVQTILPMLEIHQPPVVFKLLGTLRMTVDGQDQLAHELLRNEVLIKQLVHWSKSSDYASVTGESLRLMAWLIKHAYFQKNKELKVPVTITAPMIADDVSLRAFIQVDGTVDCMVNMLTAQHLVMQNEALIALNIMSATLHKNESINIDELLINCNLGEKMSEFITKSSDTMTKEIVENLQTFMRLLRHSDQLINHLSSHNIDELLKSIPILTEYCTL